MPAANLSTLTAQQSADLEQVIGAGLIHLNNVAAAARDNLRKAQRAGNAHWTAIHERDLAATERLITAGGQLQRAAHVRCAQARREECVAVRVVQALAIAVMREPMRVAA